MSGRRAVASIATVAAGLVPLVAFVGSASEPAGSRAARDAGAARRALASFDEYPLYDAGERVDGLALTVVLRRDDTAEFVSFVYGDCAAGDDAGCAPPAEVQVWPACRRHLGLYDSNGDGAIPERGVVRGVPAGVFDEGTRLELETRGATIVVFGDSRGRVLRVAAALRALDGSIPPGKPLPPPGPRRTGGAVDC